MVTNDITSGSYEGPAVCIFCRHFFFDSGAQSYSDDTPGYDMVIKCLKDVWGVNPYRTSQEELREFLLKANTCKHFKLKKL